MAASKFTFLALFVIFCSLGLSLASDVLEQSHTDSKITGQSKPYKQNCGGSGNACCAPSPPICCSGSSSCCGSNDCGCNCTPPSYGCGGGSVCQPSPPPCQCQGPPPSCGCVSNCYNVEALHTSSSNADEAINGEPVPPGTLGN